MPTNDERREVAARLRKCIIFAKECDQHNEGEMIRENGNVMFRDIAEAVGGDYANFIDSYEETLTKLADLIEPEPICIANIIFTAEQQEELFQRVMEEFRVNGCPNCGSKVMGE